MIWSVSKVSGTLGMSSSGREVGSSPWSETSGRSHPAAQTRVVITTIATRGAGTIVVRRGSPIMMTRPSPTIG